MNIERPDYRLFWEENRNELLIHLSPIALTSIVLTLKLPETFSFTVKKRKRLIDPNRNQITKFYLFSDCNWTSWQWGFLSIEGETTIVTNPIVSTEIISQALVIPYQHERLSNYFLIKKSRNHMTLRQKSRDLNE